MPLRRMRLRTKYPVALFTVISSVLWAANQPQFAIKGSHRDSNGVTFTTTAGVMRIEVCGDRVMHVIVSPTSEIPTPKVPIVIQPCKAENIEVASEKNAIKVSTESMRVTVDRAT